MNIGFMTFEKFHGKYNIGSTRIRAKNLIKYWSELYSEDTAEIFKHGKKYDTVIFQKVYYPEYSKGFKGKKILDLCDPDWIGNWIDIVEMIGTCDAVTVSSEGLYDNLKKIVKKPLYLLPDRHDVDNIPYKTEHHDRTKNVLWFGYSHNAHSLRPVIRYAKEYGVKLTAFCNDMDLLNSNFSEKIGTKCKFTENGEQFRFIKYTDDKVEEVFMASDFCVLPPNTRPEGYFKSDNKDTLAMCYGLPVAKTDNDFKRFLDPEERNKELKKCLEIRKKYNCKESVKELKNIILGL